MSTLKIRDELKYATGMVERRAHMYKTIGKEKTLQEAEANYRSALSAVRECRKHYGNIVSMVTDETAKYAVEARDMAQVAENWAQVSRDRVFAMGATIQKVKDIEEAILGWGK